MLSLRQQVFAQTPPKIDDHAYVPESSLCANCGQSGHYYKHCKFPICSFGIICFRAIADISTNAVVPQYLMVQRKDSLMFVEFVRGKYTSSDRSYLANIVAGMTSDEQYRVRTMTFQELWEGVWGKSAPKKCLATEYRTSSQSYSELCSGVHGFTLSDVLQSVKTYRFEREWGFPKGRRNIRESDVVCAQREFYEESGISCAAIHQFFINFEELFMGSNGVAYKHKYYLARLMDLRVGDTDAVNALQAKEISCTRWMTYSEVLGKLNGSPSRQDVMHAANSETLKVLTCGGLYCTGKT